MQVRIVALYGVKLASLGSVPGIRFRRWKGRIATMVPCEIETSAGLSVARPSVPVPDGVPAPLFRAQFDAQRMPLGRRRAVSLVLSGEKGRKGSDPEASVLVPIFDDGSRLIFEFRRAYILTVTEAGDAEVRLVAVHPVSGVVGTRTVCWFQTRYSPLAARCEEYLAGLVDLFPPREHRVREYRVGVPEGEANLDFSLRGRHNSLAKVKASDPAPAPS